MDNETCKISEEQLERRRSCILALSHEHVALGRKYMSFVNSFLIPQRTSQTQRIFLSTISKDSLRTLSRICLEVLRRNQRSPQGYLVSFVTEYPQISYDFL